ncbi:hypothetical protein C8Q73DRAFT_216304 [Cubamyces lactineus]|nr:hypothetical protein C8Q73DRAFT_216304 [Cubamyces lactineus]
MSDWYSSSNGCSRASSSLSHPTWSDASPHEGDATQPPQHLTAALQNPQSAPPAHGPNTAPPPYTPSARASPHPNQAGAGASKPRSARAGTLRVRRQESAGPLGWLTVLRMRPQFWCSFLLPLLMDLSGPVDARESISGQELGTTTRRMLPMCDDVPAEQSIAHGLGFVAPDLPSSPYTFFFPFCSSTDPRLYPRLLEWCVELYAAVPTMIPGS